MQEQRERVRIMLYQYHLSQSWLMNELEKSGISVDKSSLSDILSGRRRRGNKKEKVINGALAVLEKYSKYYAEEGE